MSALAAAIGGVADLSRRDSAIAESFALMRRQTALFKSIGKRPNPQWRMLDNPAANERPFQPFNFGNYPIIGLSPHPVRPFGDWIDDWTRAAKPQNWPDENSYVIVAEPYINLFLDKLTDVCGVPRMPCGVSGVIAGSGSLRTRPPSNRLELASPRVGPGSRTEGSLPYLSRS
jgi:hypothetical protein